MLYEIVPAWLQPPVHERTSLKKQEFGAGFASDVTTLQTRYCRGIILYCRGCRVRSVAMPEQSGLISIDDERGELEAMIEALGRSSRLAHLLHYLGEKYFAGETDQLNEYSIATEVFGRSKSTFDAGEDAIARVEAHRLRKKLKEFYEGPGKDHPLHLSIPPGSYVPTFQARTDGHPMADAAESRMRAGGRAVAAQGAIGEGTGAAASLKSTPARNWIIAGFAAALVIATVAAVAIVSHFRSTVSNATPAQDVAAVPSPSSPAMPPVRLLSGYSGAPQTGSAGEVWGADRYFHGGGPWRRPETAIARTSEPFLFQYWRTGDSTYDIPLRPGVYEAHLYFVTSESANEAFRTFTVRINGALILPGFDINSDALGENIADERVFRDVSPAADGMLHISFASERGAPQVNAIEVLPGIPHKQLPVRLAMQRTSFTDHTGQVWQPDNYYMNGRLSDQQKEIGGSPDPDLFATERYGHFTYAIPVDSRDRYTVVLHFVEFYFGSQAAGGGGEGSRVFKVMCNGETLLDNFDIYKEAGYLHVLTKTFHGLKPSAQGKLNLTFEPIENNATISGIEVLDETPE